MQGGEPSPSPPLLAFSLSLSPARSRLVRSALRRRWTLISPFLKLVLLQGCSVGTHVEPGPSQTFCCPKVMLARPWRDTPRLPENTRKGSGAGCEAAGSEESPAKDIRLATFEPL